MSNIEPLNPHRAAKARRDGDEHCPVCKTRIWVAMWDCEDIMTGERTSGTERHCQCGETHFGDPIPGGQS